MMKSTRKRSRLWLLAGLTATLVCGVSASRAFQVASIVPMETSQPTDAVQPPAVVCLGYVDLEPSVTSLTVLQPGRVTEVLVHENDRVAAGAALVRMDDASAR